MHFPFNGASSLYDETQVNESVNTVFNYTGLQAFHHYFIRVKTVEIKSVIHLEHD